MIHTKKSTSQLRRFLFLVLSAVALSGCGRKAAAPVSPPPEVLVAEVKQEDIPIYDDFVGRIEASVNASIQARVPGYLTAQKLRGWGIGKEKN